MTERLRKSNWFKRRLATNSKELKPAQVRGLSEPGFRRHWSVSVTNRFLRRSGFLKARQTGSHERWRHRDGRATTIPIHGERQIGPTLFYRILKQLGIDEEEFDRLR
jgi:predicted RNA binding protein YcfA (HicA-like mRNA interferase family)